MKEKNQVSLEQEIRTKLMVALEPTRLDVINESALHAGHRSSPGTGESHFRLIIVSPRFSGLGRVARHRLINETLADELAGRVHALAIHAHAPGEAVPG
jgi:BolA protein